MHGKVPFCVLRDPIERAVSTFNMRRRPEDACEGSMDAFMREYIEFGDVDNQHVPQSDFLPYCSVRLCFERLQEDFERLILAWMSDNVMHEQFASVRDRMISMSRAEMQLPRASWVDPLTECKSDHIGAAVMAELRGKYAPDIVAHAEACRELRPVDDSSLRFLDAARQEQEAGRSSSSSGAPS